MSTNPSDPSLKGIIRPVHFVDPDSSASDLLRTFIDQHVHMAIVSDTDGRSLGLVTLEDLIEEMVGELEDEFDRLPRHVHSFSGGTWMFGGGVPVSEVAAKLGCPPIAASGTLAAWLDKSLGQTPKPGLVLRHDGVEITVRRVRRGRVFEASASLKSGS